MTSCRSRQRKSPGAPPGTDRQAHNQQRTGLTHVQPGQRGIPQRPHRKRQWRLLGPPSQEIGPHFRQPGQRPGDQQRGQGMAASMTFTAISR